MWVSAPLFFIYFGLTVVEVSNVEKHDGGTTLIVGRRRNTQLGDRSDASFRGGDSFGDGVLGGAVHVHCMRLKSMLYNTW